MARTPFIRRPDASPLRWKLQALLSNYSVFASIRHFWARDVRQCSQPGIDKIKLERTSTTHVGDNPDFYLVSPCFAQVTVTKQADTIYLQPRLCKNHRFQDMPNYCFATANAVDFYVSSETSSFVTSILSAFAPPPADVVLLISTIGIDALRETIIQYPFTYQTPGVGDGLLGPDNSVDSC